MRWEQNNNNEIDLKKEKFMKKPIAHREGRTRSLQITAGLAPALKV